jgi:DNA processing protein
MTHATSLSERGAWVRLNFEPGLGLIKKNQLLPLFSSPLTLYQSTPATLRAKLTPALAEQFLSPIAREQADMAAATMQWASLPGHHLLYPPHPQYPSLLKEMPDAPLLLFAKGDLTRLHAQAIAIVGARNATADGQANAKNFARFLARQGFCILSGLAYGVDAAAHAGALTAGPHGGGTIAVLGTGIDLIYPVSHTKLATEILTQNGLLLSELPLGAPPLPAHFPRRNRIVAGLSRGVLVVEAALKSGSLITARLANDMGREVFALPGSIHAPLSRGPHALIQQGAKLVETGADILSELDYPQTNCHNKTIDNRSSQRHLPTPTSPLWHAIGYDPVTEESLAMQVNMLPGLFQIELLNLELGGHIVRHHNGTIQRKRTPA